MSKIRTLSDNFDLKSFLESLGYSPKDCGDHYRMSANYRGGSNGTSLLVYKGSGVWTDFGAGEISQPLARLAELSGGSLKNEGGFATSDGESYAPVHRHDSRDFKYPPSILERLLPHHNFYLERGIKRETLEIFRGGLATQGKMYQRYVFPIFDGNGFIIGFSGRNMSPSSDRPKWKHLGKKREWLYPYNVRGDVSEKVSEAIEKSNGNVVLVESIGDVLSFVQNRSWNVFCIFGLAVSSQIISTLVSLGAKSVCIALNDDSANKKNNAKIGAIKTYAKLLEFFDPDKMWIVPPVRNDFGDMDGADFSEWERSFVEISSQGDYDKILAEAESLQKSNHISSNLVKGIRKYG
jgi:hypothetical protein